MSWPKPHNLMRGSLAAVLVGAFMLALFWLLNMPVPQANEQLVIFMLGQLAGLATSAVAYYFGTTKSSGEKTDIIAQSGPTGMAPVAIDKCACRQDRRDNADVLFGDERP
ncbi:MAG: hypothetical protein B7Y88_14230 [Sphingomonadales bacterium 32-64-17]|nr:MAG: hypothetical protein B7Y88_14230 [Sphingomonadales bacterium 32-64-17]